MPKQSRQNGIAASVALGDLLAMTMHANSVYFAPKKLKEETNVTKATSTPPPWLSGKVSDFVVRVRLHPFNDADQVLAVAILEWFLATLDLKAIYSFQPGPAVRADEIGLDTGGGKFDGHEKETTAAMLVAEATGFFVACPWTRFLVETAACKYDDGDKGSVRLHRDLQTISKLMRIFHDSLLGEGKSEDQASEEVLRYGLVQISLLFTGERFRYRANGYRMNQPEAVSVIETPQGRIITMVAPIWAQVDIAEWVRSIHKPRVTISVSALERWVSILSNKDSLDLTPIAVALRKAELEKRQKDTGRFDLSAEGHTVGFWHLSYDRWLVACGTRKHPVFGEFRTKLTVEEIATIVAQNLHLCQIRPGKEKKPNTPPVIPSVAPA